MVKMQMTKAKQFKCKNCKRLVFWRYLEGEELLYEDYDKKIVNLHTCFWK